MTSTSEDDSPPLKRIREARGLSQPQLAVMSGVSIKTIGRLEGGARAQRLTVRALAKALKVSEADLGYAADGETPTIEAALAAIDERLARIEDTVTRLVHVLGGAEAQDAAQAAEDLAAAERGPAPAARAPRRRGRA